VLAVVQYEEERLGAEEIDEGLHHGALLLADAQ